MRQIEWIKQNPEQCLLTAYFLVKQGLLCFQTNHKGQPCDLLVVPYSRTLFLMHLAHPHPLGSHQGSQNTLEKLRDQFLWPGCRDPGGLWKVHPVSMN